MEDIWKKALDEFKKELPEDFFNPFIKPLKPFPSQKNSNTFILGVYDQKIISHLKENYKTPIQTKLRSIMGKDIIVDFREISDSEKEDDKEANDKEANDKEINLPVKRKYSFDNFIISSSNEMAVSACMSLTDHKRPSSLMYLYGKSGVGKTHLIHAAVQKIYEKNNKAGIYYSSANEFKEQYLSSVAQKKTLSLKNYLKNFDILVIEDVQLLGKYSESTQEEFFYLFNKFFEKGKIIILSADCSAADIHVSDRLKSRFLSGITAEIGSPDFDLRRNFLIKKSGELQLNLSDEVVNFICESITENIRILDSALIMLNFLKIRDTEYNSVSAVKKHLKGIFNSGTHVSMESIVNHVCSIYKISPEDLSGKSRKAEIALPRHLAMYLALKLSGNNKSSIARYFKKSDHTIIINAEKKIKKLAGRNPAFNSILESCIENLWKNGG